MMKIAFADLTHTGTVIDANKFPLGAGYVAATTRAAFGDDCDVRLFKYPQALSTYLADERPHVVAFSNYMWNERLSLAYAAAIKGHDPKVVTIFGGPNYPIDPGEQEAWLRAHPEVDFYIDGEGELAFVGAIRSLLDAGLDAAALKGSRVEMPSVHYLAGEDFVRGPLLPRIMELDESIPSPFLTGLMDDFFDGKLEPLMQTTRGCPYSCTFCHDGMLYMNKTRRFSKARIEAEMQYVGERVSVPGLTIADLNWGMFPEDIDTAKTLAEMKATHGWPHTIASATAKNQKQRVIEMARLLGDGMLVGASIQSTDADVLKNIKRSNIGLDAIVTMAKESKRTHTPSFSEIILCIPGDTKAKHFKSVFDMLDAGIQEIRSYQFILLPGTEAATPQSRAAYEYETRFRVLPRCVGSYDMYGDQVRVAELHEVCVGNNTMPHGAYEDCRWFDLSLAIYNHGGLIEEILAFVELAGGRRSSLVDRVHAAATAPDSPLRGIYSDFQTEEDRNFAPTREALLEFVSSPQGYDSYLSGVHGTNEIFKYRATAIFELLESTIGIAIDAAKAELADAIAHDERILLYLNQLRDVILARRSAIVEFDRSFELDVNFDFFALEQSAWMLDPRDVWSAEPVRLRIKFSEERRRVLNSYFLQYGTSLKGLALLIQRNLAGSVCRDVLEADGLRKIDPNERTWVGVSA